MDALILSCSTGGGHNAAGAAIREELEARGHQVTMMDPYELVSHKLAQEIANVYVKMVQRSPHLFGLVYYLGSLVRHVPGKSPVYYANIAVAKKLKEYLEEHPADAVIMPHLYPAELVTYLKRQGETLPLTVFVATDYVCIPFTEETDCDYYVVPGERQMKDFIRWKIPKEKLLPYGIPVARAFDETVTKREARRALGLSADEDRKYILLTGGSIGAGDIHRNIRILLNRLKKTHIDGKLIVVCGNNERLYKQLEKEYVASDSWKQKLRRQAKKYASLPTAWEDEENGALYARLRYLHFKAGRALLHRGGGGAGALHPHPPDSGVRDVQYALFHQKRHERRREESALAAFFCGGKAVEAGKCREDAEKAAGGRPAAGEKEYLRLAGARNRKMSGVCLRKVKCR